MGFLGLIPSSVWVGLGVFVAASLALFALDHAAYKRGEAAVQVRWDAERVRMQAALEREKTRQAKVVEVVRTEYVDRVKIIKEKGDEIVREVRVYVPAGGCELPPGWRVLHDAAARGDFPDDPDRAIAAAAGVEAATAAETVAGNYASCRADQARLAALQQLLVGLKQ